MTGHAWPLTHDDAKTRRRKTNYTNTDTLPTRAHRARPIRKRELTNLLREDRRGQLRLSLTNTYHEWPVKRATRRMRTSEPRSPDLYTYGRPHPRSFFRVDQCDPTAEKIINATDHLDLAILDSGRHNGLQSLEPLDSDLDVFADRVFQRVAGHSFTHCYCRFDELHQATYGARQRVPVIDVLDGRLDSTA